MADQKDEWDDLMGEIESEKSAQKKRAAMNAAADDILKAGAKADKAEGSDDSADAANAETDGEEPDAGAAVSKNLNSNSPHSKIKPCAPWPTLKMSNAAPKKKSLPRAFLALSVSPMISYLFMIISPARFNLWTARINLSSKISLKALS